MAAIVLDLISELHIARPRRCTRVRDHGTPMTRVVLLERQASRREAGACACWTRRMLTHESLQVLVRRGAIAARLLQFGE